MGLGYELSVLTAKPKGMHWRMYERLRAVLREREAETALEWVAEALLSRLDRSVERQTGRQASGSSGLSGLGLFDLSGTMHIVRATRTVLLGRSPGSSFAATEQRDHCGEGGRRW